jgi:hypothetical protein
MFFQTTSCRRLWCAVKLSNGREGCRTHGMPWAEGSTCGKDKVSEDRIIFHEVLEATKHVL